MRMLTDGLGLPKLTAMLLALALGVCAIGAVGLAQEGEEDRGEPLGNSGGSGLTWFSVPWIDSIEVTSEGFLLRWTPASASGEVVGYGIRRLRGWRGEYEELVFNTGTTETAYLDRLEGVGPYHRESGRHWRYQIRVFWEQDGGTFATPWSEDEGITVPNFGRPTITQLGRMFPNTYWTIGWIAPNLSWSDDALQLTGYRIWESRYESIYPRVGSFHVIGTVGPDATSFDYMRYIGLNVAYRVQAVYGRFLGTPTDWVQLRGR